MSDGSLDYWERHASRYGSSMKLLGGPLPRMIQLCGEAVRDLPRVLEVAAGPGLVTVALAKNAREVVATDYARGMVERLEDTVRESGVTNVRCEQADVYALAYQPLSFDAVVAANVLHLVPDLAEALASMRRVMKPGGKLIAPTFCHDETAFSALVSRGLAVTGFPGHRRFTAKGLRAALEVAGLHITREELIPGLLPISWVEARFANP